MKLIECFKYFSSKYRNDKFTLYRQTGGLTACNYIQAEINGRIEKAKENGQEDIVDALKSLHKYVGKFSVELSTDKNKSFIVKGAWQKLLFML